MNQKAIRLLVADDQGIVRKGVQALLSEVEDMNVVGEAEDGQQAIDRAAALKPDVILMDLQMPRMDGIEAIQKIKEKHPRMRILALTSFSSGDMVFPAIKAGALGYLLKDSEPKDLLTAIRQVNRGEPFLQSSIARKVFEEISHPARHPAASDLLTQREMEVLKLVALGMDNHEIANHLVIGEATVRTHISNILDKLHLANRVQAALYALRIGLTSLDDQKIFVEEEY